MIQKQKAHLSLFLPACAFFFLIPASAPCCTCCQSVTRSPRKRWHSRASNHKLTFLLPRVLGTGALFAGREEGAELGGNVG